MTQRCVLFDMDGTLYDSDIDILAIRKQLELPQDGRPILAQLEEAAPEIRDRGIKLLHAAEAEAAANGQLIPGTRELIDWLRAMHIRCGLVTNNSQRSVDTILAVNPLAFDVIVTRDDAATKPRPDLFLLALDRLHIRASDAVAVGDTHLDAIAAHRAGIREIHLISLRDGMVEFIPSEVEYAAADDLTQVRVRIAKWLERSDA